LYRCCGRDCYKLATNIYRCKVCGDKYNDVEICHDAEMMAKIFNIQQKRRKR